MPNPTDRALVAAATAGDESAVATLMQRHRQGVRRLVQRYVGAGPDCDDLTQDILSEALLSLGRLKDHARFGAWVRGIARHRCISWLRRRPRTVSYDATMDEGRIDVRIHDMPGNAPSTPEDDYEREEERRTLDSAMRSLPERSRTAATLHYLEGKSYQEVAAALNVTINTVEGRLYRARQQLRREILDMGKRKVSAQEESAVQAAVDSATAELRGQITELRKQMDLIHLEDNSKFHDEKMAAASVITRLPSDDDNPITWGIVGAYRLGVGRRSGRVAIWSKSMDDFLDLAQDDDIANVGSLFSDSITATILKQLVKGKRTVAQLAKQAGEPKAATEQALARMEQEGLVTRDSRGRVEPHTDAITILLTLINLSDMYQLNMKPKDQDGGG